MLSSHDLSPKTTQIISCVSYQIMGRTPMYNFYPSKAQEEYQNRNNIPHTVTYKIVDIRHPMFSKDRVCCILKTLTHEDFNLAPETLVLCPNKSIIVNNLYAYWPEGWVKQVEEFKILKIELLDIKRPHEKIKADFYKRNENYHINSKGLVRIRNYPAGYEVVMYWDNILKKLCFDVGC